MSQKELFKQLFAVGFIGTLIAFGLLVIGVKIVQFIL